MDADNVHEVLRYASLIGEMHLVRAAERYVVSLAATVDEGCAKVENVNMTEAHKDDDPKPPAEALRQRLVMSLYGCQEEVLA